MERGNIMKYQYNCFSLNKIQLKELEIIMDNANSITYNTFSRNVGKENMIFLNNLFGYSNISKRILSMKKDYSVNYLSSKVNGKQAYIVQHSAIEHVFYK